MAFAGRAPGHAAGGVSVYDEDEAKASSPLGAGPDEANEDEDRKLALRLQGQEQARAPKGRLQAMMSLYASRHGHGAAAGAAGPERGGAPQPGRPGGEPETDEEASIRLALEMEMEEAAAFQQRLVAMAGAGDGAEEEEEEVEVPLDEMTYQEVSDLQDAIGYVSRAAPATAVKALPSRTYEATGEDEKCAVCQFSFEAGEVLTRLPCSHEFHADCCTAALAHNKRCPMCKADMMEQADPDPKRRRS